MFETLFTAYQQDDHRAARRRVALLTGLTAVPALLIVLGAWQLWPLLVVPVALAAAVCGPRGLALTAAVTALAFALASEHPGVSGAQLVVALLAAVGLSLLVAGRHAALTRDLRRAATESLTDRLTALPNYAFISDALPRELRRAERYGHQVSLLLLDLDRFKRFNDQYGHADGNRLLARVGGTLLACARASDLPARFGGEEFVIVIPGPLAEAAEAAERIRKAVAESRIPVGAAHLGTTVSIGIAEHAKGERLDGSDLVARADRALYAAKQGGRDRCMVMRADAEEPVPATALIAQPGVYAGWRRRESFGARDPRSASHGSCRSLRLTGRGCAPNWGWCRV
ncbi:MAG: diguanylate cyclase [Thermoleophilia bacterium]